MGRSTVNRLKDIIYSANLVLRRAGDHDANALFVADGPRDAVLFRFAVVCEAASQLPADIQALAPEIPWRRIKNMRNEIVHAYWQIDYVVVVDTISTGLGPLTSEVQRLLSLVERNDP
jgi:uncharacterized protein with HEPN domain